MFGVIFRVHGMQIVQHTNMRGITRHSLRVCVLASSGDIVPITEVASRAHNCIYPQTRFRSYGRERSGDTHADVHMRYLC